MAFLTWLENLGAVTWVRESESLLGYTLYLAAHTIGLVCLVGPNLLIAARVLGLAPRLPIAPLAAFRPLMTFGAWITIVTGSVLFATAPVSYVRNGVFIVKIGAIVVALLCLRRLMRELFERGPGGDAQPVSAKARALTTATLIFWTVAVVAGRLTAYSGIVVFESLAAFLVLLLAIASITYVTRAISRRAGAFALDVGPAPVKGGE